MIQPINQAPQAFIDRYQTILKGDEKLSTAQQLADFWLFAIEQGLHRPEMREYIATCVIKATNLPQLDSPIHIGDPLYEAYGCWNYCSQLHTWAPEPNSAHEWKNQEEFYNYAWDDLAYWVNRLATNSH